MSRNRPIWKILSGIHKKEFSDFEEDNTRIDKFMELIRNYTDCSELTTPMIHEFIDKMMLGSKP